jgi:hypothetical protein
MVNGRGSDDEEEGKGDGVGMMWGGGEMVLWEWDLIRGGVSLNWNLCI